MHLTRFALTAAFCALPAVFAPGCSSAAPAETLGTSAANNALASIVQHPSVDACGPVPVGVMRCHAKIRTDITDSTAPQGFGPPDLRSAYNLPSSGGSGQTVAIVDAQDDPDAESDLAVYRKQYGLPACTTANGCFKKVNQNGEQGSYPKADSGWAGEISLDLDMVSAVCPSCNIILVEASSATTPDLGAAVQTAAMLGANAISNSYGGSEDPTDVQSSAQYYSQPGILVTASAGDNGYGAEFPASSQFVLGVGGTSLVTTSSSRGWTEGAWSGTGSGCSSAIGKPSFQTDTGCANRTVADVSAVADPNTGVSVYVSYGGNGGWNVYGGTSAASPIIAATFVLVGKANQENSFPYVNTSAFYDVTSGSNGTCSPAYLCTAGVGYDGPTGWGTPNGVALAAATNAAPPVTVAPAGGDDAGGGGDQGEGPAGPTGSDDAGSATEGSDAGASPTGSQDGNSNAGSQDGNSQDGSSQDGSSQDGSSQDGNSQDGNSQDGNSDAGSQDGCWTGSQDSQSSQSSGSQDGCSTQGSQGAAARHGNGRAPAWRRLGAIVKGELSHD